MKKKNIFLGAIFILFSADAIAQKIITNYWPRTKVIGEQYQIDGYGVKNGFYKEYNRYGTIIRHFNYSDGKENGLCIEYITMRDGQYKECDGKPMVEKMMKNGDEVVVKEYSCSDGNYYMFQKREANKKEPNSDRQSYTYTEYYPSGKIAKKYGVWGSYKVGSYIEYYENGNVKEVGNYSVPKYVTQLVNGHFYAIGENRDTQYSVWFDKNYPVIGRFYYPNGKVKDFIKLTDDYESQIIRHFDENGNLTRSSIYRAFAENLNCAGGVVVKNRREAMEKYDDCYSFYNPYDFTSEKNDEKDLIYLETDSIFENSTLKSVEKFYPYSYKNDYGVIKRGALPEKIKNEIDSQNNIAEMKNQFYRQTEAAVAYLKSKFVEPVKAQYQTYESVNKKHIYNAFGAVYQDFIFGNMYVVKNEISRMTTTQSGLYSGKKVTHIFSIPGLYYTDYLMLYKNDSFNVYYKKLENLNSVVLPSNADLFEFDDKYGISGITAGTEYEGTYYASGVYFKPQSVNKPWMTDIEQLNAAAEFFKAGKAAIDRLAAQEDTKDLEKQLKATKDPKELRKLLGM
jgi:antitoxin component YwqK of YwqJK toxin-antitoxin module